MTSHTDAPYEPVFAPGSPRRKELDDVLTRYPTKMAALLPALWMVQYERGWVSDDGMAEVAQVLALTPAYVKGVVTFYTMYHLHPVGVDCDPARALTRFSAGAPEPTRVGRDALILAQLPGRKEARA